MWELNCEESWASKNWCFWTVVLEKTLESPLDCKEIQPVILKEISPECSLEGLMLKLKLQYFGHLMWKSDTFEKTLMLGRAVGEGDDRGWDSWMASLTQWTWVWVNSGSWWWTRMPGMLQSMGSQRVEHDWATELHPSGDQILGKRKQGHLVEIRWIDTTDASTGSGYLGATLKNYTSQPTEWEWPSWQTAMSVKVAGLGKWG